MENNQEKSMVDYIIKKWFPIIGVLFVVGGISYLFYDGLWQSLSEGGRLTLGFVLGILFIAGGYSFDKKLKGFADVVIGGGILILYLTLIFGSRFEGVNSALIPELWALIVALIFSTAVAGYSYSRKSKHILALGLLGGYLTPFFIGKAGEFHSYLASGNAFDYNLSLPVFLIYFAILGLAIFLVSNKMFLKGIGLLNSVGLFLGTFSLVALKGDEFSQHTGALVIFSLVVIAFHISAMVINARKFENQSDPFLIGGYILPLVWFVVFMGSFVSPQLSDNILSVIFGAVSFIYFGAWYYIRNITHSDKHFSLYISGMLSLVVSIIYILPIWKEYAGLLFSLISLVFLGLYIAKPLIQREISFLIFGISGVLYNLNHLSSIHFSGIGAIKGTSIFIILTLIPFIIASPTFKLVKIRGKFGGLRKLFGYLAIASIVGILIEDIIGLDAIPTEFLFLTIPAAIILYSGVKEKEWKSKNKFFIWSSSIAMLGFYSSFMTILNRFYPAPEGLYPLSTTESLIGISTLVILYLNFKHYVIFKSETAITKVPFFITFSFYLTLWSVVTHEMLGLFNMLGLDFSDPHIQGIRAFTITLWWVALAIFMMFRSEKTGLRDQKNIGFALLAATILKLVFYDLANVNTNLKVFLFIIIGAAIMAVAYYKNKNDPDDDSNDKGKKIEIEKKPIAQQIEPLAPEVPINNEIDNF